MLRTRPVLKWAVPALLIIAVIGISLLGCRSTAEAPSASASPSKQFYLFRPPPKKGGAELWAENCTRCHNARPPEYYSDAQWDAVVHHMRLRANLTGQEQRTIAEFLKASN